MILLRQVELKIRNSILRDHIIELNLLVSRMETDDCLEFMSCCSFIRGVQVGLELVKKAQKLESFLEEEELIDSYLEKLDKIYTDYAINDKNKPN